MTVQDLDDLAGEIRRVSDGKDRTVVAIAGPPGAGKSTIAGQLAQRLDDAAMLPMDGFHLDNATLAARGMLARKGAPDTFDVEGFLALIAQLGNQRDLSVPTFDRDADSVVPGGDLIPASARIVLVEGNYLLLDAPGWRDLVAHWTFSVMIDVPLPTLEQRLIQRWRDQGLSDQAATARAQGNDLPNAQTVLTQSLDADVVLRIG